MAETPERTLNVGRLIDDLGGERKIAKIARVPRTAPYRWRRLNYISSGVLERVKTAHPELDLDEYFEIAT